MPKEVRKRGRRAEKARQQEKEELEQQQPNFEEDQQGNYIENDNDNDGYDNDGYYDDNDENQPAFFGLVDEQELDYFKQAESTLAVDSFGSMEERRGFIRNVFEETRGKELKLVTNHYCSRLIERLILIANDKQIFDLFKALSGNFAVLVKNKFASHCVETLIVRAAPFVEKELLNPNYLSELYAKEDGENNSADETVTSFENLFLYLVNEIKPEIQSLPDHQYASHFLRLLLLILAGKPIPATTEAKSALRSRRSKMARKKIILSSENIKPEDDEENSKPAEGKFQVPSSFKDALDEVVAGIVKDLNTSQAREMSIHPVSSPVIQVILTLESEIIQQKDNERQAEVIIFDEGLSKQARKNKKKNHNKLKVSPETMVALLFPYSTNRYKKIELQQKDVEDDAEKKEKLTAEIKQKEESYVEYLLSDPVGSHFMESLITTILPIKLVSRLTEKHMVGRMGKLVRRKDSGLYVVQSLLKRMSESGGRKDLATKIMDELTTEIKLQLGISKEEDQEESKEDQEDQEKETKLNDGIQDKQELNYGLIRNMIEISHKKLDNYKVDELINILISTYDTEKNGELFLPNLLDLDEKKKKSKPEPSTLDEEFAETHNAQASKMQKALLLQTMINSSDKVAELILKGLVILGEKDKAIIEENEKHADDEKAQKTPYLIKIGRDSILSHVFERGLYVSPSSSDNTILRRKFLNILTQNHVCENLAANVYGSHIVDELWKFCFRLKFFRERIAEQMVPFEEQLKMTGYGKSVWRNWHLDEYKRRRRDWWNYVKNVEDEMSEKLGLEQKNSSTPAPGSIKKDKPKFVSNENRNKRKREDGHTHKDRKNKIRPSNN